MFGRINDLVHSNDMFIVYLKLLGKSAHGSRVRDAEWSLNNRWQNAVHEATETCT